jgi:Uma2 family endonuclease
VSERQITEVDLILTPSTVRRWTREEYDRMIEAGILGPEDSVELIEGEILVRSPTTSAHAAAVERGGQALRCAFGTGFTVRSQRPLALGPRSQPEPDLSVVQGSPKDYVAAHPTTALLVIEVADASLGQDRSTKARLYSGSAIPEYWIVNIVDHCIEVHRDPTPEGYRTVRLLDLGDKIAPVAGPGVSVLADELLV